MLGAAVNNIQIQRRKTTQKAAEILHKSVYYQTRNWITPIKVIFNKRAYFLPVQLYAKFIVQSRKF